MWFFAVEGYEREKEKTHQGAQVSPKEKKHCAGVQSRVRWSQACGILVLCPVSFNASVKDGSTVMISISSYYDVVL